MCLTQKLTLSQKAVLHEKWFLLLIMNVTLMMASIVEGPLAIHHSPLYK